MMYLLSIFLTFFLFSAPATSEIYTLSLHDALPISRHLFRPPAPRRRGPSGPSPAAARAARSPFSSPRRPRDRPPHPPAALQPPRSAPPGRASARVPCLRRPTTCSCRSPPRSRGCVRPAPRLPLARPPTPTSTARHPRAARRLPSTTLQRAAGDRGVVPIRRRDRSRAPPHPRSRGCHPPRPRGFGRRWTRSTSSHGSPHPFVFHAASIATTVSTCAVWGKRSNARTAVTR